MGKFVPVREDGLKAWVVTISDWGRIRTRLVWAEDRSDAKYVALGRKTTGIYAESVRRATMADLEAEGS